MDTFVHRQSPDIAGAIKSLEERRENETLRNESEEMWEEK